MTTHASGTFEVKLNPQDDRSDDATLGRMTIDKQFHGDLEGLSKGQMLTAGTAVKSSAGYVAIEKVNGTLLGRKGSFVLQHSGTITRGAPQLSVTVVPDSGTEDLEGLAGNMTINIADGKHSEDFEFTLAKTMKRKRVDNWKPFKRFPPGSRVRKSTRAKARVLMRRTHFENETLSDNESL